MAKNKSTKKPKSSIDIIIVICTILIIAIIAGIAILTLYNNKPNDSSDKSSIADAIENLGITENPVATIEMENGGKILVELFPDIAPNTVCNFIELANSGFYDGLIFHRCIKDFMIQGGDPEGTGMGGPDYSIKGEFSSNGFSNTLSHDRGVISMARSNAPNSAGSQFFITVSDEHKLSLDGRYASFGKVIKGIDVVDEIVSHKTDPANDRPLIDQVIKSIRVDTKGITYPDAEKIK